MLLYQAVLQYSMGMDHHRVKAICSTHATLYFIRHVRRGHGAPDHQSAQPDRI